MGNRQGVVQLGRGNTGGGWEDGCWEAGRLRNWGPDVVVARERISASVCEHVSGGQLVIMLL